MRHFYVGLRRADGAVEAGEFVRARTRRQAIKRAKRACARKYGGEWLTRMTNPCTAAEVTTWGEP